MKKRILVCAASIGLSLWYSMPGEGQDKLNVESDLPARIEATSTTSTKASDGENSLEDSTAQEDVNKTAPVESTFQVLTFGNGIKIAADGRIEVYSSNNTDSSKMLPQEVQTIVKDLKVQGGNVSIVTTGSGSKSVSSVGQAHSVPAINDNSSKQTKLKIIVIGPDGKSREAIVQLPEPETNSQLSTFRLHVTPILQASGIELNDATRKALETIEQARQKSNEVRELAEQTRRTSEDLTQQTRENQDDRNQSPSPSAGNDSAVEVKLTEILNRLERLESEIRSLKGSK